MVFVLYAQRRCALSLECLLAGSVHRVCPQEELWFSLHIARSPFEEAFGTDLGLLVKRLSHGRAYSPSVQTWRARPNQIYSSSEMRQGVYHRLRCHSRDPLAESTAYEKGAMRLRAFSLHGFGRRRYWSRVRKLGGVSGRHRVEGIAMSSETDYPIREAALKDVYHFFKKADELHGIMLDWDPVITGCDRFAVAEQQTKIVGAVATSSKVRIHGCLFPSVAFLYVLPNFERKGIGRCLLLYAMDRLLAESPQVYCSPNQEMIDLIGKVTAELKGRLKYSTPQ